MKKIIIAILFITNLAQAANIELVQPGEAIDSSFINKISQTINKILDLAIPTGENNYSARIAGATISNTSTLWLQSCSNSSSGIYNCIPHPSLGLTQRMNCSVTLDQSTLSACLALQDTANSSATNIRVQGQETSRNAYCGVAFTLSCQRAGNDYKPYKSIRQILVAAGLTFLE